MKFSQVLATATAIAGSAIQVSSQDEYEYEDFFAAIGCNANELEEVFQCQDELTEEIYFYGIEYEDYYDAVCEAFITQRGIVTCFEFCGEFPEVDCEEVGNAAALTDFEEICDIDPVELCEDIFGGNGGNDATSLAGSLMLSSFVVATASFLV